MLDVTGLRVFTYFYTDEAAVMKAFTSHGYGAPAFAGRDRTVYAMPASVPTTAP